MKIQNHRMGIKFEFWNSLYQWIKSKSYRKSRRSQVIANNRTLRAEISREDTFDLELFVRWNAWSARLVRIWIVGWISISHSAVKCWTRACIFMGWIEGVEIFWKQKWEGLWNWRFGGFVNEWNWGFLSLICYFGDLGVFDNEREGKF